MRQALEHVPPARRPGQRGHGAQRPGQHAGHAGPLGRGAGRRRSTRCGCSRPPGTGGRRPPWRTGVGWLYAHLGQYDQALEHCQRALTLHRESGNRGGIADTLDSLGYAYLQLGDLAQAKAHYAAGPRRLPRDRRARSARAPRWPAWATSLLARDDPRPRPGLVPRAAAPRPPFRTRWPTRSGPSSRPGRPAGRAARPPMPPDLPPCPEQPPRPVRLYRKGATGRSLPIDSEPRVCTHLKALLVENIHPDATARLAKEGYQVETLPRALGEDELIEALDGVSLLGIRSQTQVTDARPGRRRRPASRSARSASASTRSTWPPRAAAASPCSTRRSPTPAASSSSRSPRSSRWPGGCRRRTPRCTTASGTSRRPGAHEVRGRRLGIVGYGNIGTQLSVLAENLGMSVYFYDVADKLALGNARRCSTLTRAAGDGRDRHLARGRAARQPRLLRRGRVRLDAAPVAVPQPVPRVRGRPRRAARATSSPATSPARPSTCSRRSRRAAAMSSSPSCAACRTSS